MRYYLARYIGTGTPLNRYRPATVALDEPDWWSTDLRPDSTVQDGYCLLASLTARPASLLLDDLGDNLDDTALATRLVLESKLGIALEDGLLLSRLRNRIRQILIDQARTDGTRWRPLQPERDAWRIYLGGLIDEIPRVAGGAVITESFNKANSDTLGPDLTWIEFTGDIDIVSNKARTQPAGAGSIRNSAQADSDLASSNHYAKADVTWADANSAAAGTAVRFSAVGTTYYTGAGSASADVDEIVKVVSGTGTQLASQAHTIGAQTLNVRTDASGSSISVIVGAAATLSVTDTSITTGTRCGIQGVTTTNVNRLHDFDTFEAGDLGGTTTAKSLAGTATPAGALARSTAKPLVGIVTPAGAARRQTAKALAGTTTPTGAARRATGKITAGTLAPTGATTKNTAKAIAGTVTPTGALQTLLARVLALAGSISPTGALTRLVGLQRDGATTPTGDVTRLVDKQLDGTMGPDGGLAKTIAKAFAGSVAPDGTAAMSVVQVLIRDLVVHVGRPVARWVTGTATDSWRTGQAVYRWITGRAEQ